MLDKRSHDVPDRHVIGEALLRPETVTNILYGAAQSVGSSLASAREDHAHSFILTDAFGSTNKFINGEFQVRQLGNGPFNATGYTADMVILRKGTGSTHALNFGSNDGGYISGLTKYYMSWDRTVAGSTDSSLEFLVENARNFGGGNVTVSFYTNNVVTNLDVYIAQMFGSGGSPSATVLSSVVTVTTAVATTRHTVSFAVPETTGKTFGTNVDDRFELRIRRNIGYVNGLLAIWGIQIENGTVATPFETKSPGLSDMLCRRYYRVYGGANVTCGTGVGYSATIISRCLQITMDSPMRAIPVLSFTGTTRVWDGAAFINTTGISTDYSSVNILNADMTIAAGGVAKQVYVLDLNGGTLIADARL